jgi:hypothetical protein
MSGASIGDVEVVVTCADATTALSLASYSPAAFTTKVCQHEAIGGSYPPRLDARQRQNWERGEPTVSSLRDVVR